MNTGAGYPILAPGQTGLATGIALIPNSKTARAPLPGPLPAHASQGEGQGPRSWPARQSLACLIRRVKGVHFKLDSGVELGMKQRNSLSSMKWRLGRGGEALWNFLGPQGCPRGRAREPGLLRRSGLMVVRWNSAGFATQLHGSV